MFFLNNPWSSRMYLFSKKPSSSELGLGFSKTLRKEGDSNPRYGYPYDSLANCWFQPLTHPSPRLSVIRHALSEMLFFESACKGTTKNANTQIFLEKNVFLYEKGAYLLHLTNVASGECWKIRSSTCEIRIFQQAASEGTGVR